MGGGSKGFDWPKESYRERNRDNDRQRSYRSYSSNRRSSDYRTEDFHSKDNNDYDYGERKYRSQNEHRNKEYRERRSRSRSCERDSKNYDYDSNKIYDRYEDRDRNHKDKKEVPNNTLMVRNLPLHITDKDLTLEINKFGLYPKDVRLMKNKETGQSRGFAFIEFATVEQAVELKQLTKDYITIEGEHECSLHFSFPKEVAPVDKNGLKSDWSCPKCGINNFKRRDKCFKCGTNKDETRLYDETNDELVQQPTNVLLLRNLSSQTTEERVLTIIGTLTSLPIKSIRIKQDSSSQHTNMCYLELHSIYEATQLFSVISSLSEGFVIDDSDVTLSYGQRIETSFITTASAASQNAALAALAAANWKNLDDSSSNPSKNKYLGKVTINGVEYTKYDQPNYQSFQYDTTSGYYYDPSTGFYYDSKSQYFYNSITQKYMYYDTENKIYVTVDSNGKATTDNSTPVSSTSCTKNEDIKKTNEDNINKNDKVKIAKKIAKDMEKWAKTLNQKKEVSKPLPQVETVPTESNEHSATDAVYNLLEKQMSSSESNNTRIEFTKMDPFEIIKNEEERMIDRNRLACLLCKRQFNSVELLTKHQQLSDLHKTNLTILKQTVLNEEQLEHVENIERELGYRDRAKERRDKYGFDDTPEYAKQKKDNEKEPTDLAISSPPMPLANDNLGSRMLRAMGWTEGTGLGKSNQGISGIIEVERRRSGLGLGNRNSTFTKESYKEAVKRTALQRFKEMSDS